MNHIRASKDLCKKTDPGTFIMCTYMNLYGPFSLNFTT